MRWSFNKKTAQMDTVTPVQDAYSFCETVTAGGGSPWHIRELTARGPKFGGGSDTPALCGRKVAWDLKVEVTPHHLSHCCSACAIIFRDRTA